MICRNLLSFEQSAEMMYVCFPFFQCQNIKEKSKLGYSLQFKPISFTSGEIALVKTTPKVQVLHRNAVCPCFDYRGSGGRSLFPMTRRSLKSCCDAGWLHLWSSTSSMQHKRRGQPLLFNVIYVCLIIYH